MSDRSGLAGARPMSRRGFLRGGGGLALTLPWLESLPVAGRGLGQARRAEGPARAARAVRLRLLLQRRGAGPLVGAGPGGLDGDRPRPEADGALPRGHGLPQGPVQRAGRAAQESPPRAHGQHALRRLGQHRAGGDPRRPDDGPGPRATPRRPDRRPEPRPRHRADRAPPRGRTLDDLRLVHLVGQRHQAGDQGDLPRARLRPARRRRRRPPPRPHDPRRGARRCPRPGPAGRASPTAGSSTSTSNRSGTSSAASNALGRRPPGGPPALASGPGLRAPAEQPAPGHPRPHAADAGPDRPGVPDGQDARRHADAEQRPVADELRVPRGRPRQPPPGPHAQRPRAGSRGDVPEDEPVPRRPVRLPRRPPEGDRRGRGLRCSTTPC